MDDALNDSIGSRAPRGAMREGLSTFWIDRAEVQLRQSRLNGVDGEIASGNVTCLRVEGDVVIAAFDFDPDGRDAESMPIDEFLGVLDEWRRRIIEAGGASGSDASELGGP